MFKGIYAKSLFFAILMCLPFRTNAYDFQVDGIYYEKSSSSSTEVYVTYKSTSYNSYSGIVDIPSTVTYRYVTYNVTSIGYKAFYGCTGLTSVTIPSSVTSIGNYAFRGCSSLTSLTIPASTSFSNYGYGNSKEYCPFEHDVITDLEITGEGNINAYAFWGFEALQNVFISNGVTGIDVMSFRGCTSLTSISLPDALTSIGKYAFSGCESLTSISLPDALTSIGNYAFDDSGLSSIDIPKNVSSIGEGAFDDLTLKPLRLHYDANCFGSLSNIVSGIEPSSIIYAPRAYHDEISNYLAESSYVAKPSVRDVDIQYVPVYTELMKGVKFALEDNDYWEGSYALSRVLVNNAEVKSEDGFYVVTGLAGSPKVQFVYADEEGNEIIDCEYPSLTDPIPYTVDVTQTTATVSSVTTEDESATVSYVYVWYYGDWNPGEDAITFTGLAPGSSYSYSITTYYSDGTYRYGNIEFTTESVTWGLSSDFSTSSSSFRCPLSCTLGDAVIDTVYTSLDSKGDVCIDVAEQDLVITGLNPSTTYSLTVYGKLTVGVTYKASTTFTTDELTLTTEQPNVLSSTSAQISATTNLDEEETNVGFEWRKTDSPDEVASKSATAEIYDGELSGVIKNLSESTYYKYRAYYTSYTGTTYYGDWVGIDTDDYSYFEPTVKTGDVEVSDSYVTVKGYALQGTEDIEDQGFEYWVSSSSAKSSRISSKASEDGVTRVTVDGQKMMATLTDLLSGTTYEIRAYATTASGTTYGETVQFTTAEATGISNITASGSEGLELLARQSDGVQIAVSGGEKDECNYRIFSMTGGMVASGKVAADGSWYTIADTNTLKGIYVIIATDGSETKARKLFVK